MEKKFYSLDSEIINIHLITSRSEKQEVVDDYDEDDENLHAHNEQFNIIFNVLFSYDEYRVRQ